MDILTHGCYCRDLLSKNQLIGIVAERFGRYKTLTEVLQITNELLDDNVCIPIWETYLNGESEVCYMYRKQDVLEALDKLN
jgi:hypothetical protein